MRSEKAMVESVRLRISAREKGWLQAAADIQGVTLSYFIRAAAHRSAENILYQRKTLPSWNSGESISLLGPSPDELDAAVEALARQDDSSFRNTCVSAPPTQEEIEAAKAAHNSMTGSALPAIKEGDELVCVNAERRMKLTVGKRYVVQWNRRPDINFPTVINDDGRPTMYNPRWFELADPRHPQKERADG